MSNIVLPFTNLLSGASADPVTNSESLFKLTAPITIANEAQSHPDALEQEFTKIIESFDAWRKKGTENTGSFPIEDFHTSQDTQACKEVLQALADHLRDEWLFSIHRPISEAKKAANKKQRTGLLADFKKHCAPGHVPPGPGSRDASAAAEVEDPAESHARDPQDHTQTHYQIPRSLQNAILGVGGVRSTATLTPAPQKNVTNTPVYTPPSSGETSWQGPDFSWLNNVGAFINFFSGGEPAKN